MVGILSVFSIHNSQRYVFVLKTNNLLKNKQKQLRILMTDWSLKNYPLKEFGSWANSQGTNARWLV